MLPSPHNVTKDFELALAMYCGSPFAVTVTSCTMALLLACAWHKVQTVDIPKRTYVSVPMSIMHAGGRVTFRDENWRGLYQLKPYPIWDAARRFRRDMWKQTEGFVCVSFHWGKPLGIQQGGAILHGNPEADKWLRRARFDGRSEGVRPKDDTFDMLGWHCYMSPEVAAEGLMRLSLLPDYVPDKPWDDYPDLSTIELFRGP